MERGHQCHCSTCPSNKSILILEPPVHADAEGHSRKNLPEKIGLRSGVLRNTFRNPKITPEKLPENFTGPKSFRVFWETHARFRRTKFIVAIQTRAVTAPGYPVADLGEGPGGASASPPSPILVLKYIFW